MRIQGKIYKGTVALYTMILLAVWWVINVPKSSIGVVWGLLITALTIMLIVLEWHIHLYYTRTIEMSKDGCKISWGKETHDYLWREIVFCKRYTYGKWACRLSQSKDCILFSVSNLQLRKWENSPYWIPYLYCATHKFTSFCIHLDTDALGKGFPLLDDCFAPVKAKQLLPFLESCGVKIEGLDGQQR